MYAASVFRRFSCLTKMAGQQPMSYSAALSRGTSTQPSKNLPERPAKGSSSNPPQPSVTKPGEPSRPSPYRKRSPSPSHVPQTGSTEENIYILTLQTDDAHHARMTKLRDHYFPKRLNKLEAHLTLFHALPGSRLESDIIPAIEKATQIKEFAILAEKPFQMKHGVAISLSNEVGGIRAKNIHTLLQTSWKRLGFLSPQDAGGARLHYTLMNKADEQDAVKAFAEISENWKSDQGIAVGLGLWRYDRGFWRWERDFKFLSGLREGHDQNDGNADHQT